MHHERIDKSTNTSYEYYPPETLRSACFIQAGNQPLYFNDDSPTIGCLFFAISIYFDQWHWFQRSGALIIIVGAISSARRILRKGLDCLLCSKSYLAYLDDSSKNSSNEEAQRDIKACYCGFWILGVGTIIWAYGDLAGCLQTLSGSCLY